MTWDASRYDLSAIVYDRILAVCRENGKKVGFVDMAAT